MWMTLTSCMRTSCPVIEIPDRWRNLPYIDLTHPFRATCHDTDYGISPSDAKSIIKNQIICEQNRQQLIDIIDATKGQ